MSYQVLNFEFIHQRIGNFNKKCDFLQMGFYQRFLHILICCKKVDRVEALEKCVDLLERTATDPVMSITLSGPQLKDVITLHV